MRTYKRLGEPLGGDTATLQSRQLNVVTTLWRLKLRRTGNCTATFPLQESQYQTTLSVYLCATINQRKLSFTAKCARAIAADQGAAAR